MLGKFTSLFYESDAPKAETPKTDPAPKAAEQKTISSPVVLPTLPVKGQNPEIDNTIEEMSKVLEVAIQEANLPGFDYIEFRDVLSNMATLGLPEEKMFQAAFASAQIAKITKEQLIEAINFYLKVIGTKAGEFNEFITSLEASDIAGKDKEIAELDKLIEEDAKQIQQLTTSIGERRNRQDSLRMKKAQADIDIKNKKAAFDSVQNTIVGKLNADRNKINTYIK